MHYHSPTWSRDTSFVGGSIIFEEDILPASARLFGTKKDGITVVCDTIQKSLISDRPTGWNSDVRREYSSYTILRTKEAIFFLCSCVTSLEPD